MKPLLLTLGCVTFIFGLFPLFLTYRFRKYVRERLSESEALPDYHPRVSIILPCKGVDPGFEKNIGALLSQDYPDYEIIIVTATEDDPAHLFLRDLFKQRGEGPPVRFAVAGISEVRGQKINNMLEALNHVSGDSEVFVFVDSDIRPEKDFLRKLVAPLKDPPVGAATGMRWYMPKKGNLGSMLRSVWAAGAYPLLIDQRYNFVYGGANAVRRETFERGNIRKLLDRSISDTFAIARGVKSLGLKIHFVPRCIVVSHEDSSLLETVEWTNRQTIISRVYGRSFWWMVFLTYSFSNAMLVLGFIALLLSAVGKGSFVLPGLLLLSLIPLEMINAALLLPVVQLMIPQFSEEIRRLRWRYYLTTPLASILIMINSLVSLTTNVITWRGVRYRLVSPEQTDILSVD